MHQLQLAAYNLLVDISYHILPFLKCSCCFVVSDKTSATREELPESILVFLLLERPLLTPSDLLCLVYSRVSYVGLLRALLTQYSWYKACFLGSGTRQRGECTAALAGACLCWLLFRICVYLKLLLLTYKLMWNWGSSYLWWLYPVLGPTFNLQIWLCMLKSILRDPETLGTK